MLLSKTETLLAELAEKSWSVQPCFFDRQLIQDLKKTALSYQDQGLFQAAKISTGNLNVSIRNDQTCWVQSSEHELAFLDEMEKLRLSLNEALLLGLFEYEAHFAHYAKGSFYRTHLDSFQKKAVRKVSTVIYLNESWQKEDGGELALYNKDNESLAEILPAAGTLVAFLSDAIPHEVKAAHRERWSIAGWFRTRS
jgi:SM-20-related protein